MGSRKRYTFWIEPWQVEQLAAVEDRDGVRPSEQIRRALDAWFAARGLTTAARKRARTRRRTSAGTTS